MHNFSICRWLQQVMQPAALKQVAIIMVTVGLAWLPVTMSYGSDVELVQRLLVEAVAMQPRVVHHSAPTAHLYLFGETGLEFRVGFWVKDPENSLTALCSAINVQIWRSRRVKG